ncbi:MAG: hypothetical protein WC209_16460 [Ignavibacteriaceae bacterium]|jgi:hypothetical protein
MDKETSIKLFDSKQIRSAWNRDEAINIAVNGNVEQKNRGKRL